MSAPNDEHNQARAGDMEAAILDAIEVVTRYLVRDPRLPRTEMSALSDRLQALANEIDDAREGRDA